jgi:hypothetical protein
LYYGDPLHLGVISNKRDVLDDFTTNLEDDHYHDHAPDNEAMGDDMDHEAPSDNVDLMSKAIKRHLFKSQEMPKAAAYTEDQTTRRASFFTPNTLKGEVGEGMAATMAPRKNKERKRPGKKGSQPAPKKHVLERIHMLHWREIHELGELILPEQDIATLTGDMRSPRDTILHLDKTLM